MNILNLSTDLYRSVYEYTDINVLLNTSKKFNDVKYELYYWKLNKEHSLKYYDCIEFRDKMNSIICKTLKQLSLNLCDCIQIEDVSILGNCHTLNLSGCNKIKDVSVLRNTYALNLCRCSLIRDVSGLGEVHILDLSMCRNIDVSALRNVHTLILWNCRNVKNLSAFSLGKIDTLNLERTDVDKDDLRTLGNVRILYLNNCTNDIRWMQELNNVYKIYSILCSSCEKAKKRRDGLEYDYSWEKKSIGHGHKFDMYIR